MRSAYAGSVYADLSKKGRVLLRRLPPAAAGRKEKRMNGYQQYREQSLNTMTQGELLLLLYDEILKRLGRAEAALDVQNYELFEQSVQRSADIVSYLQATLDHQYPISRELDQMYDFFIYEFSRIKAGRKKAVIEEVRPLIADLREAFQEADKKESGRQDISISRSEGGLVRADV